MADLRYKVVVDEDEARKKLRDLLSNTGVSGAGDTKAQATGIDAVRSATVKLKEAQLANIEALRQARLEAAKHKKEQADLNTRLTEGKISSQQFRLEQAKLTAEQKEQAKAAKELKKKLADNSEYSKLTRALNNVRKETKDVLAEMFSLERRGYGTGAAYEALKQKSEALTKQTQYLDKAVKRIDATVGQHQRNVGNYASALDNMIPIIGRVNGYLEVFNVTLDDLANKPDSFKNLTTGIKDFGKALWALITSPVGAFVSILGGLFALFQANKQTVIDFDSGLKNVSKTTGIAGAELTSFGDAVIDLSMKLKVVDTKKLLEYATVAGQLGVKGRADILAFTEALAMLETASDISGEEGGANIARMLTLVDGGVQNVKDFGDEIVNLGNNFAATEKEILDNATQISQNVGIYKIGRQEVLAFATATKAVGLEAELVGSTFSRTLGEFEKTLRTGKGVNDLLKVIGGSQAELQKRFRDDAAGVFVDYVKGLNNIHKAGGSVNEALDRTGIIAVRDQRVIASLASNGYDVLTDALNKVSNAQGAMLAEFENGASKLEQQSKRMGIAWDNFVLSIENGEGVIGRSVVAVIGFFAELLDQINRTFNPTSADEFWARMNPVGNNVANKIRDINKSFESSKISFDKVSTTSITNSNANDLLKETESAIKSASEAYKNYKSDVNAGVLTNGGKTKLEDFKSLLDGLYTKQYQLKLIGAKTNVAPVKPVSFEESEEETRKKERSSEAAARKAEQAAERSRQAVERQRSLQLSIDGINEQVSRNNLSRDQQEIASVEDKYKKIREEVRKFYADPKNKSLKVDESGLQRSEKFEISEAKTRQETIELVKKLNDQREIYTSFNAYVEQNGIEATERMFGKQAELAKGYRDQLRKEYLEIVSLQNTATVSGFSGSTVKLTQAQEERAKALKEMLDALEKEDNAKAMARFTEALKLSETFATKEHAIRKKYSDAFAVLEKQKTTITEKEFRDRADVLKKAQQDELKSLIESNPDYEKAMKDISDSSKWLLAEAFKRGKEVVNEIIDGMDVTPQQKAELKKIYGEIFDKGSKDAEDGNFQGYQNAIGSFEQLVNSATQFDGTMSNALKTIGSMVRQVGDLMKSLGGAAGKAGGPIAIAGAIVSMIGGISEAISNARLARRQQYQEQLDYNNDYQLKQVEAITQALERQLALIQEIYGTDRVTEFARVVKESTEAFNNSVKAFDGNLMPSYTSGVRDKALQNIMSGKAGLVKFQLTGDKKYDEFIKLLNEGADFEKAFGKKGSQAYDRAAAILKSMINNGMLKPIELGFSTIEDITLAKIEDLQKLIDENKLDEVSKREAESIIANYKLFKEAMNQFREELTGVSFSSLTSGIVSMFEQGKTSVKDFTDFFEKQMQQAVLKGFSRKMIETQMQGWYEEFYKSSESNGGLDLNEIASLRESYFDIMEKANKEFEELKKLGIGLGGQGTSSQGELSKGISGITETTANRLEAEFGGLRLAQLALVEVTKSNHMQYVQLGNARLSQLIAIQNNTFRTANNTDRLAGIEAAIVSLNSKVVSGDALKRGAGL